VEEIPEKDIDYMQEINRLNEVIANKNEELEVIRQHMEI
jgi:hypothetical protein